MKWIAPHGAVTADERYRNAEPNIAGSNPDAEFFNNVLDELLAVITTADLNPSDENMHQIADAIVYLTERAATSGVTKGSYWFGKTTANFSVPAPTAVGQTYIDFTDLKTYISNDGSTWTQSGTFVPPTGIDFTILITSKFWDIIEQSGQQGGEAKYNHTDDVWAYWPKIISFQDAALTGTPTAPTPSTLSNDTNIATTAFVRNLLDAIYPVGSIYIGTTALCPLAALFGTWELIQGRYLLASGTLAGTSESYSATNTVAAGLPNITGQWTTGWSGHYIPTINVSGAISTVSSYSYEMANSPGIQTTQPFTAMFNASWSNSIYGSSTTVRPPAYVVNVWRRTA